ncbi:MAG: HlyD family secretion protein [Bacteroidales bacterium]
MKSYFPSEIVHQSTESLFVERHTRSSVLYLSVIGVIVLIFTSLPFIRISITTQSRGIIRSANENNNISSAYPGRIEHINLQENQPVSLGDTLIILNTEGMDEEISWYHQQISKNTIYIGELEKLLKGRKKLQTSLYQSNYLDYHTHIEKYEQDLNNAKRDFQVYKKLHEQEVIPDMEFEEKKYLYRQAINARMTYERQARLQWENELERLGIQKQEYQSRMERLKKKKQQYIITSPVNGTITQYSGLRKGNFLVPNKIVAQISPDQDLLVECYLSPADIGLIRDSMNVRFQFDAFDYNQWGLGTGKVRDISNDIITRNNQPVFKVRCTLDTRELQLKNGYWGKLKKGMTLTARFQITERSLFQLLYDKMDDWLNPKLDQPQESS